MIIIIYQGVNHYFYQNWVIFHTLIGWELCSIRVQTMAKTWWHCFLSFLWVHDFPRNFNTKWTSKLLILTLFLWPIRVQTVENWCQFTNFNVIIFYCYRNPPQCTGSGSITWALNCTTQTAAWQHIWQIKQQNSCYRWQHHSLQNMSRPCKNKLSSLF